MATVLSVLGLGLTACGDDNDEPEMPDTWTTSYTISVTFHQDFLDAADIIAHIAKFTILALRVQSPPSQSKTGKYLWQNHPLSVPIICR